MSLQWLFKARSKYWEQLNTGKRYAIFRRMINRSEEYASQYTMEEVSKRVGITPAIMRTLESGVTISDDFTSTVMPKLIKDLGVSEAQFYSTEKVRADTVLAKKEAPVSEAPTKSATVPSPRVSSKGSTKSSPKGQMAVVNHTGESYFILVENDKIHIYEDSSENLKKLKTATWVAPADDIGRGAKLMPRETQIK